MAETAPSSEEKGSVPSPSPSPSPSPLPSLKDQGNQLFKAGNFLKAAAVYTQAIKLDPSNPTLYSNRSAAFLHLFKLNKALSDADATITLNPEWEKGYFRKGCVLEAMEKYEEAIAAFQVALERNPQNAEVTRKIKRLTHLARDQKRVQEVENIRANINMRKYLDSLKDEIVVKIEDEVHAQELFDFTVEMMEASIKGWHEAGRLDSKVHFLLDKEKTQTEKYAPVVNIDKAFESPHTHGNCFSFLRQYAEESFSHAACLVAQKSNISYPQVWKGQGSRKWRHGQTDGFFVQFESPFIRKLWFVPSSTEKGQTLCRDPEAVDVDSHEVVPRIFK